VVYTAARNPRGPSEREPRAIQARRPVATTMRKSPPSCCSSPRNSPSPITCRSKADKAANSCNNWTIPFDAVSRPTNRKRGRAGRGAVASAVALAPIGFWSARERAFCQASVSSSRGLARLLRPIAPALLRLAPMRALFFAQYAAHPTRISAADALGDIDAIIGAGSFEDVRAAFTGYLAPTSAADRVPVTIAWGNKDRLLLPRQLERARRRLPRARCVLIRSVGHLMMRDDPQAVADVIRSGVRAPPPEGPAPSA